jgi:hypothetical protein
VIRKLIAVVFLVSLIPPGRSQNLAHITDSLLLRVSRSVELEDESKDTVSCSRNHRFIWFSGTSETAEKLNRALYADLTDQPVGSTAELKEILKSDFGDWAEEWNAQFAAEESAPIDYSFNLNWYEESNTGISYQAQSTLCIFQSVDGYYGGAHPTGATRYRVFSLPDANEITDWRKLFTDTAAVLKMAEEIFRNEKGLSPKVSLEEAGYWFNNNRFHLTDNFGLDTDGLFFMFNPYEVAPYAEGPIYISIPFQKIKKYLRRPL